jgi:hypothetical protein
MNKIYKLRFLPVLLLLLFSCDSGFDELNTNETDATSIDPAFQLNNAVINSSFPGSTLVYDLGIVQQIISPNSGVLTGANYNQDNRDVTRAMWREFYRDVIKNTRDVIDRTQELPERSNLMHMARIIQAFGFMILTDTYGDIPYFEGGKAFTEQIFLPKYDSQQAIYADIIKELGEACAALNASGNIETADVLYGGNIDQWKKFGYSLMLRAGMRLSKVDATQAQQVVQAAFQGGVILLNADNAVVRHDANYTNALGTTLNATEANNYYLAAPFVSYLKTTNDPRLASIAVTYVGAKSGPEQVTGPDGNGSNDPAIQTGMPLGYDNNTIVPVAANLGLSSFYEFSQVDRTRMAKQSAPMFLVTAAQTHLLLAEAAQRGWVTGSAEEFFNNGVRAHMMQLESYDADSAVPLAAIDAYLTEHPFSSATALEQINTQYWIASFLNGPEVFANFRRSGYPALTPNPFPGQDISGDFIRRYTYPNDEISVNTENVNAAIARMGPDNLETRVWWDVQ